MNIFELIFFVANVLLGSAVARRGFQHWGWIGALLGFIGGFAIIPTVVWLCGKSQKKGA
jgi:uncharacterized membrane protein